MKKYVTPDMEIMAFAPVVPVAGLLDSLVSGDDIYNNTQFPTGSWK